jgi:hypothetical protein
LGRIQLFSFSGSHYEIGYQQGKSLRELIYEGVQLISSSEAFKMMKPRFLPFFMFLALAKRRACKLMEGDISEYYPEQAEFSVVSMYQLGIQPRNN